LNGVMFRSTFDYFPFEILLSVIYCMGEMTETLIYLSSFSRSVSPSNISNYFLDLHLVRIMVFLSFGEGRCRLYLLAIGCITWLC